VPSTEELRRLRRAGIAGHPHSQPNSRYRCFLPDLTEFTRFVIERDPAIAALRKAFSNLLVPSEGANRMPRETAEQRRGGEGGIRTHGTLASTPDFESGTFNRTPPPLRGRQGYRSRAPTGQPQCATRLERLTCLPSRFSELEACLARDDLIQATGTVDKILGGGRYQITLESGQLVTAQLSGRMRRFRIRVIPGDRVQVGVSPYDPTHGFVTFRLREGQNAPR
jgi:translation initiation factor IF-1